MSTYLLLPQASSQYIRIPMAAPILGDDYGGYRLMDVNAQRVLTDHIVSMPTESELMYVFQFPPDEELYWSLPVFPGKILLKDFFIIWVLLPIGYGLKVFNELQMLTDHIVE